MARSIRNPERIITACLHLGIMFNQQGNSTMAEIYLQEAKEEVQKLGYQWLICNIHIAFGEHYLEELQKATDEFSNALKIAKEIESKDMLLLHCMV